MKLAVVAMLALSPIFFQGAAMADASKLWGERGEKWSEASRLPDFSFAGYRCGEVPIPDVPQKASVKDFGARGDGVSDDTQAFIKAVAATENGTLFIPEGRYVLTDTVRITKSNLVLRGAGPDKTVLVIPKSLEQIHGEKTNDGVKSSYSFGGGFIVVAGNIRGQKLANVTVAAKRGDRVLTLSTPIDVKPNTFVRLQMRDKDHTLGRYLHNDEADAGTDTYERLKDRAWIDWAAHVAKIEGNKITLDRPLRLDVRREWQPEIHSFQATVSEVGIENLSFEFPGVEKKAHLKEEGFNAIHMTNAVNSWVRNVVFTDADNGVIVGGSRFCTVENVLFKAVRRKGITGHHALWATGGTQDSLFQNFDCATTYVHDLTVEGRANGNVFRDGKGVALNFDHHRNAPYENLFTNLDVGNARRLWQSSGRGDRGPHTAVRSTFWNMRGTGNWPKAPNWAQINVIGVPGQTVETSENKRWIEPAENLQPADLYLAQRAQRLKNTN